ncbi:metallophosphoesterase family protein [Solidesulfovibrio sp.]
MLLLLGDVHSRFAVINEQIADATKRFGRPPEMILQLGDLGFYKNRLEQYFQKQQRILTQHVHFIDGNHEDFPRLPALAKRYARQFTHLPRCATREFLGCRFLFLGGASYMDSINTPPGSVITNREIEACLQVAPDAVDIVVSHDCPRDIGVQGKADFNYCGTPGFAGSRRMLKRFAPRFWFFAHHHEWFEAEACGTRFYGLAPAWEGYGVLEGQDRFTLVRNRVEEPPPPPGPARRNWRSWFRPDTPEGSAARPSPLRRMMALAAALHLPVRRRPPSAPAGQGGA